MKVGIQPLSTTPASTPTSASTASQAVEQSQPVVASELTLDPPVVEHLPPQPPAQLGPSKANFLARPSGLAVQTVDPYLTTPDRVNLARTSKGMRQEISKGVTFQDSQRLMKARYDLTCAQRVFGLQRPFGAQRDNHSTQSITYLNDTSKRYDETRDAIIEARAARGLRQPHYAALREVRRLHAGWSAVSGAALLSVEQLLVEAIDATDTYLCNSACGLHNAIWLLDALERAEPRDTSAIDRTRQSIFADVNVLLERLRHAMTADLPARSDLQPQPTPRYAVVFTSHFLDEVWTHGKMLAQTHINLDGTTSTQSLPWPDPAEGPARLRFKFGAGHTEYVYVHALNLPLPMDTPD